jgi:5'-3' exonuclease
MLSGTEAAEETEWIVNYACMMSMLGNDFLPSSLSYKMRDDGHGVLVEQLAGLFRRGLRLVGEGEISREGVAALFREMAAGEEERVAAMVLKKRRMASERAEVLPVGHEDYPLAAMEETALLWFGPEGKGRPRLERDWRDRYLGFFHGFRDSPAASIDHLCREYLRGIQWVWSYYTGAEVCFEWSYPWSLPPLWVWLAGYVERNELPACGIGLRGSEIEPVEQLAIVLPLASWSLIPPSAVRALPYRAPHLFPSEFQFDSVGKRYFWECECRIPVPTVRAVRSWCGGVSPPSFL